jgi:hypothetical protein
MAGTVILNGHRFGGYLTTVPSDEVSWLSVTLKNEGEEDLRITHIAASCFFPAGAYNDVIDFRLCVVAGALFGVGENPLAEDSELLVDAPIREGYVLFDYVGQSHSVELDFMFTGEDVLSSSYGEHIVVLFGVSPDSQGRAAISVNGCKARTPEKGIL